MLFHVTLRHSPVDCPGRNPDKARASRVHFAERKARQREPDYQVRATALRKRGWVRNYFPLSILFL